MSLSILDKVVFIIITIATLYAVDVVDYKKFLKSNNPRKAFLFYILFSFSLIGLVFNFYIYLKSLAGLY